MKIVTFNEIDLPRARPLLQRFFALNGISDIREFFKPHEEMHAIAFRERRPNSSAMLLNAIYDRIGDANVERPVRLAGENIDEVRVHAILYRGSM